MTYRPRRLRAAIRPPAACFAARLTYATDYVGRHRNEDEGWTPCEVCNILFVAEETLSDETLSDAYPFACPRCANLLAEAMA